MYTSSSPYFNTSITDNNFLDIMINRPIGSDVTDVHWEITPTYHLRPDLLAFDLYNDPQLWWVFSARNPNSIQDPLFDFVQGKKIYIPQMNYLRTALGL